MKSPVSKLKSSRPKLLSKRADKKRVNISWSHSLFFQIGLIVSLIAVFFIMESTFGIISNKPIAKTGITIEEPYFISDFEIEVPKLLKAPRRTIEKPQEAVAKPLSTVVEVVHDVFIKETPVASVEDPIVNDVPHITKPIHSPDDGIPKNINFVEFAPVYPGCENLGSNKEKIACMSSKISEFVQKKFRTNKFSYLNPDAVHKVYVSFKIDKTGEITDVKARATNSDMEKEGTRVVEKLPNMIPGKQGSVNVDVMYMLPIVFKVN